jgi:tetratricopeptide (TPR) repeat protein
MNQRSLKLFLIFLLPILLPILLACGWDWDTIKMEKQQFPQIHELITGKFFRHSQELYYWRIKHRSDLLKNFPDSLALYDDLAMAYDKTGDSEKAIEVMEQKNKIKAGVYETHANLGLFYMHSGEIQKGVDHVAQALKINPDAHFGREKYQLYLGKYIVENMKDGKIVLPLSRGEKTGFYNYLYRNVFKNKDYKSEAHFKELADAIKGVSGMMTFANYRSPVLLEALADLLLHTNSHRGAGHLASRAYLKASFETEGETAKAYYEKARIFREYNYMGEQAMRYEAKHVKDKTKIDTITGKVREVPLYKMNELELALKLEVQSAELWFDSLRKNEIAWIKGGKNPDNEFDKKYYQKKEPVNKGYDSYNANANAKKLRNDVWLKQQLSKPKNIANIHGYNSMSDSVKKVIDAIYLKEFGKK